MNPHYRLVRFLCSKPETGWPSQFGIITAWNPMDRKTTIEENERAHKRLVERVARHGLISFPAIGGDAGMVHREPGLAICFPSEAEAIAWGKDFDQRAVFWIAGGELWLLSCIDPTKESLGAWEERIIGAPQ